MSPAMAKAEAATRGAKADQSDAVAAKKATAKGKSDDAFGLVRPAIPERPPNAGLPLRNLALFSKQARAVVSLLFPARRPPDIPPRSRGETRAEAARGARVITSDAFRAPDCRFPATRIADVKPRPALSSNLLFPRRVTPCPLTTLSDPIRSAVCALSSRTFVTNTEKTPTGSHRRRRRGRAPQLLRERGRVARARGETLHARQGRQAHARKARREAPGGGKETQEGGDAGGGGAG